jgi:CubicO group peptidase (beta-lactamase class C family)
VVRLGRDLRRLAAMEPLWPIGSASGYHPVTWGYLAGELHRRVDGRTMGAALREDFAEPHGLDLVDRACRTPSTVAWRRCSGPNALPDFGEANEPRRLAFGTPWAAPGGRGGPDWRRAEIPSANGHATAPALAGS